MIEIPDLVYRLLRQMTACTRDAIKGDRDAVEITPGGEIKGKLKVGSKVRVKKGLGMVSGKTGTILRIRDGKALVDMPYYDIREIFVEDLELVCREGE
ncbi:hypothetical protein DRN58_06945 [Thermococci archaeon]|nr:MAG: hypothetical protein DRN58_06945 [Thermococci archaeon]